MDLFAIDQLTNRQQGSLLLSHAAAQVWGLSPLPQCSTHPGGKPFFPDHPSRHFNLSHSGRYALCAVGECPVGVDIQIIKTTFREGLPHRVCSPEQLLWLEQQHHRWRGFARLWSMKESRVKWDGSGLTHPIRDISIPTPVGDASLYFLDGLWFRLFSGTDWEACVCAALPPPETIHWISL